MELPVTNDGTKNGLLYNTNLIGNFYRMFKTVMDSRLVYSVYRCNMSASEWNCVNNSLDMVKKAFEIHNLIQSKHQADFGISFNKYFGTRRVNPVKNFILEPFPAVLFLRERYCERFKINISLIHSGRFEGTSLQYPLGRGGRKFWLGTGNQ